jgi:hypothetical protein
MKKYLVSALFIAASFNAFCQQPLIPSNLDDQMQRTTRKRIDSIINSSPEYKDVSKEIADIPMGIKKLNLIFIDSTGSNGERLKQDVCNYRIGYKEGDMGVSKYIYWIYYSISSNRIMFLTKKPEESPYLFKI